MATKGKKYQDSVKLVEKTKLYDTAEGSLQNFPGTVVEVDPILGRVKVHVQMFFNRTVDEWFNFEDVVRREE